MSDDLYDEPSLFFQTFLFVSIAALMGADIAADRGEVDAVHLAAEAAVAVLALVGLAWSVARWRRLWRRSRALAVDLSQAALQASQWRAEAERWRQEAHAALAGLGDAIDQQFQRWGLSPAEREVGLLLLKGLSLKEIAELRAVSERTVRQQAQGVYRKAGLEGRADLSAFFLEDLLLPRRSGPEGSQGE